LPAALIHTLIVKYILLRMSACNDVGSNIVERARGFEKDLVECCSVTWLEVTCKHCSCISTRVLNSRNGRIVLLHRFAHAWKLWGCYNAFSHTLRPLRVFHRITFEDVFK
jgi:hypothetical protein